MFRPEEHKMIFVSTGIIEDGGDFITCRWAQRHSPACPCNAGEYEGDRRESESESS